MTIEDIIKAVTEEFGVSRELLLSRNTHVIFWDREEGLSVGMQICCYTDNVRFATKEEKAKLFDAIKSHGYEWNTYTKTLETLTPNKFDITALKPFESKVLVRHNKDNKWCGSFFSHIDGNLHSHCYKYVTIAGKSYPMCIPYEGNEHLSGATNNCIEYYKTWE